VHASRLDVADRRLLGGYTVRRVVRRVAYLAACRDRHGGIYRDRDLANWGGMSLRSSWAAKFKLRHYRQSPETYRGSPQACPQHLHSQSTGFSTWPCSGLPQPVHRSTHQSSTIIEARWPVKAGAGSNDPFMSATVRDRDPPDIADCPMDSVISPARRSDSPGIHPVVTQALRTGASQLGVKRPRLNMRHFKKG
jgi:hypothetical protein